MNRIPQEWSRWFWLPSIVVLILAWANSTMPQDHCGPHDAPAYQCVSEHRGG